MTTQAAIGYGSVFELFDVSDFVPIGEVTSITPPNISVDAVDATHTESEQAAREFIAGLIDYGEVKVEMNLVPGSESDALIRAKIAARQHVQWRITFPSPTSPPLQASSLAILTGYETTDPLDDKMMATLSMKISGPVTYT